MFKSFIKKIINNSGRILGFSDSIIKFILINSTIWVYLSYVLAFLGREEIAQDLAVAVVTQLICTIALNHGKATIENLSKNNNWPDKNSGSNDLNC